MIRFPRTAAEAVGGPGEIRAGATDIQDRRNRGMSLGPLVDLRDARDMEGITAIDGSLVLGATTKLKDIAENGTIRDWAPLVAKAAGGLATPQIRALATLGGNLLQRNRCWYYRNPAFLCFKNGGDVCNARIGDSSRHAVFDVGPSLSVHASTMACALLCFDASCRVIGSPDLSIADLYGDGSDPTRDHRLPPGSVLHTVRIAGLVPNERGGYLRSIARREAEWPIVEAAVRIAVEGGQITLARVAIGGVAPVPIRLPTVEQALVGALPSPENFAKVAALASAGANPTGDSGWKVAFIAPTVAGALENAMEAAW
jgi:xanthine dehydrogenase YagS FAD-binding subunit